MHVRRIVITAAAALALVAGGTAAGAAIASGPVSNSGVIDGCYTNAEVNGSHAFVLQDQGTSCPSGTTAIEWNQTGPQGPAGPAGPQGPPAATDTGTVQVIQQVNTTGVITDTCTSLSISGPDAKSITVSTVNLPSTSPDVIGCDISRLPQGFTWNLTPIDDVCSYNGEEPTTGGTGTPCPNYTQDNSSANLDDNIPYLPGLTLSGDYGSSAQTDLLVDVPLQVAELPNYVGGDFIWQAIPPAS
jgi:hypothetical protein